MLEKNKTTTKNKHCDIPASHFLGDSRHERYRDEDDELLQFAIQQSLMESGTENDQVTFYEALSKNQPPAYNLQSEEERMLQRWVYQHYIQFNQFYFCARTCKCMTLHKDKRVRNVNGPI